VFGVGVDPPFAVPPGAVPAPRSDALTTRVAVGVGPEPLEATTITLSPTAKLLADSGDFFVPNFVALVTSTVTVLPLRVRMVQVPASIDWIVARNAIR
jgi:hypothetical protein